MKPALSQPDGTSRREFADGLGVRTAIAERGTDLLELLSLNPDFLRVPAFEFALRERVGRLANFRHAYYARVRRVDRLDGGRGLGIVSEHAAGARLSDVLDVAERHSLDLDVNAALCLIRQIVPAIAMLHHNARDVAHGVLGPERILVTPQARIVITEYVLGSAVEQLGMSREGLWRELQVAVPAGAGNPRLDRRADVMQIGLVSLALILGRRLPLDDLRGLPELLASATETTVLGEREPISTPLRRWLSRSLQLDSRGSFASAEEAQRGLEDVLSDEGGYVAAPVALEAFLLAYREHAAEDSGAPDAGVPAHAAQAPAPPVAADAPPPPAVIASPPPSRVAAKPSPAPLKPVSSESHWPEERAAAVPDEPRRPLEATASAAADPVDPRMPSTRRRPTVERMLVVLLALLAVGEGVYIWISRDAGTSIPVTRGMLSVESQPAGATLLVDGRERGVTPLQLQLPAGAHVIELRAGDRSRVVPLTVRAGVSYAQYVELPAPVPSEPSPEAGVPALTAAAAKPQATGDASSPQARPASDPAPAPVPAPPPSGWIAVTAPYDMQILENGTLVGRSGEGRIALPAGAHTLEIVNDTLAFRTTRRVNVPVGGVRRIPIELPLGSISVNASPWAEVWIDGERVGETPIGNLPISIGAHEVVFKHPELGERRHAVSVTLAGPARLSVNMKP